jgi:hypothetical protein
MPMKTDPVESYILKNQHNLRIAAAINEAWSGARDKLVSAFFDRLQTRLKRKLKGYEYYREGQFFVDAYPGYYFWKPEWEEFSVGLQCYEYGERMLFGLERDTPRSGKRVTSEELLNAVRQLHPSARANAWWGAMMVMTYPAGDWRKPAVLWQMHKDPNFLDSVAEQLVDLAKVSEKIIARIERRKK